MTEHCPHCVDVVLLVPFMLEELKLGPTVIEGNTAAEDVLNFGNESEVVVGPFVALESA